MDLDYWEGIGKQYEDQIFSSSLSDAKGRIRKQLDAFADPRGTAADFGCGVGYYLPLLAKRFRRVYGFDFAQSLVDQAAARCQGLSNVSVGRANLASARTRLRIPKVRFGVCANVLISDDEKMRSGILRTIRRHMVRGGTLLLVVPSIESEIHGSQTVVEWNRRLGFRGGEAAATGFANAADVVRGIVDIEGTPTKCYLREELPRVLAAARFELREIQKLEYAWETEFDDPPAWMKAFGPWDWLVMARATGR